MKAVLEFAHSVETRSRSALTFGFALLLIVSSIGQVLKFLGFAGVAAYVVVVFAVVAFVPRLIAPVLRRLTDRQALWLAGVTLVLLVVVFAVGYPIATSGRFGKGSDREDNLNLATAAFLRGESPYEPRGYLGAPVDVLGGTILLAVPFVLIGNSAYQNLVWLAVFFVAGRWFLRDGRRALVLLWLLLALAPAVAQELVTGGDLIANSLYPILFALFLVDSFTDPEAAPWRRVAAPILFGIGIASRVNFALIAPVLMSLLVLKTGWRAAIRAMVLAGGTFLLLTVPFYLHDPAGYAPLHLQNRFGMFRRTLPHAELLIPLANAVLALVLSLRRFTRQPLDLLRNSTAILAFPVVCGMALAIAQWGARGLMFAVQGWGLFFLFSGALYFHARLSPAEE